MGDLTDAPEAGNTRSMKRRIHAWLEAFRRHPIRTFLAIGSAIAFTIAGIKLADAEDAAFDALLKWAVATSRPTMVILLHFVWLHRIWIPWSLVPLTLVVLMILAAIDAKAILLEPLPSIEQIKDQDLYMQAKAWLETRLSQKHLYVAEAFLYGSIVHDHYPTSDVDVLIVYKSASDKRLKRAGQELQEMVKREFRHRFGHALHSKFLCAAESELQRDYLATAGDHIKLDLGSA